mmetsp:Transcript_8011/g.16878  ORF Transcript_8011/g.16878 Transcript_8011/m.16878 type:complete len:240 (-) Transcript_8011:36-755(-)
MVEISVRSKGNCSVGLAVQGKCRGILNTDRGISTKCKIWTIILVTIEVRNRWKWHKWINGEMVTVQANVPVRINRIWINVVAKVINAVIDDRTFLGNGSVIIMGCANLIVKNGRIPKRILGENYRWASLHFGLSRRTHVHIRQSVANRKGNDMPIQSNNPLVIVSGSMIGSASRTVVNNVTKGFKLGSRMNGLSLSVDGIRIHLHNGRSRSGFDNTKSRAKWKIIKASVSHTPDIGFIV